MHAVWMQRLRLGCHMPSCSAGLATSQKRGRCLHVTPRSSQVARAASPGVLAPLTSPTSAATHDAPHRAAHDLSRIREQLESTIASPTVDAHRDLGVPTARGPLPQPSDSPAVGATHGAHTWGAGLTVPQFMAAVQALPMQQKVHWKSMQPPIGEGTRGKVYQAVNLNTGGLLAVKVVSLNKFLGSSQEAALRREALVLELAAMQDYQHPHVLAMQGFYLQPCVVKPRLEIYSELGCCLEDLMPQEDGTPLLGLPLVQKVMKSLVQALAFLHQQGVVHRDVKPGNIVSVGSSGTFKLIDMDSIYFLDRVAKGLPLNSSSSSSSSSSGGSGMAAAFQQEAPHSSSISSVAAGSQQALCSSSIGGVAELPAAAAATAFTTVGTAAAGTWPAMGDAWQLAPSATRAADAAATVAAARRRLQQQQQQQQAAGGASTSPNSSSSSSSAAGGVQLSGEAGTGLNALNFAGTPGNLAPEAAPRVLEPEVVLWDLIPWKEGKMAASQVPVDPARDIWSAGTVLFELLTGRPLFDQFDSPEQLYQHMEVLRSSTPASCTTNSTSSSSSSSSSSSADLLQLHSKLPEGVPPEALAVLLATLQLGAASRPSAEELLTMPFFTQKFSP